MGDRALVLFTDGKDVSPTVYLHDSGRQVPQLLREHEQLMKTRKGDVDYAAARFIGVCHTHTSGNLSLGCWNTPEPVTSQVSATLAEDVKPEEVTYVTGYAQGDAGVVVVDVRDYKWKAFGGYLAKPSSSSPSI